MSSLTSLLCTAMSGFQAHLSPRCGALAAILYEFPHQPPLHSHERIPGTPSASVRGPGCHFAPLTFLDPRQQNGSPRLSRKGEALLRRSQRESSPPLGLSDASWQTGEGKGECWNLELSLQCGLEARGRCCQLRAKHRVMDFAFSWGFYLCWHGNKLVLLFISSVKVL